MDAMKLQGKGKADKVLAKIQKLYGIELRLKGASSKSRQQEIDDPHSKLAQAMSRFIIEFEEPLEKHVN